MTQTFDVKELLERVDNDVAFLADTVQMLESDGAALLGQMKASLAAGDAAAVGRTAHTLKGMVANFCAPAVHELALEAE
jgi:HPt (histidine-containing phosphotransfer) domain-containing protein